MLSSVPGFVTNSCSFSTEKGLRPLTLDTSDDDSISFINGLGGAFTNTPNSAFCDSFGTSWSVQPPEISPLTNVTSDISSNIDTPVRGTSHEVLLHASSPSMDNVGTNSDTYMKTSPIIGYKIVGDYICPLQLSKQVISFFCSEITDGL